MDVAKCSRNERDGAKQARTKKDCVEGTRGMELMSQYGQHQGSRHRPRLPPTPPPQVRPSVYELGCII